MPSFLRRRGFLLAGFAVAALFLAGCTEEPVRVYEAPREKQRLLAAMVPADSATWFFKLMGNEDATKKNADAFWKFVRSVRFSKDNPEEITWTLPDGWTHEPGSGMRYATFRIPNDQVVTAFKFGPQPELVIENINRWRKQLKLPPLNAADVEKIKKEEIDGNQAWLIDFESARTDAIDVEAIGKSLTDRSSNHANGSGIPTYKVPDGWTDISRPGRMAVAAFRVGEGDMSAETTLLPLPSRANGVAENVNRWRGQLGLSSLPNPEAEKEGQTIEVDGVKSVYVDYTGSDPSTSKKLRLLGVICPRDATSWFVKLVGPPEIVEKQKSAFEAFVRSIRFGGGKS